MAATVATTIEGIETQYLGKCTLLGKFDLPPGKDGLFDTSNTTLTIQINRHYRFVFMNAAFKTPWVTAGIWGSSDLCPTSVTNVFEESFSEGDVRTVTLEGKEFTLRRNGDKTDFKYWSLDIPANL